MGNMLPRFDLGSCDVSARLQGVLPGEQEDGPLRQGSHGSSGSEHLGEADYHPDVSTCFISIMYPPAVLGLPDKSVGRAWHVHVQMR